MRALLKGHRKFSPLQMLVALVVLLMFASLGSTAWSANTKYNHLVTAIIERCEKRVPYDVRSQQARQAMVVWFNAYIESERANVYLTPQIRAKHIHDTEVARARFLETLAAPPPGDTCDDLRAAGLVPGFGVTSENRTIVDPVSVHQP